MKGIAMKKLTRILTMGGFGLLAALATGAGPANAATAHSVPESKTTKAHQVIWRDGNQVVGFYRTLVIVPYIMSATAQGVLFSFVFDSQFGVANSLLHAVGIAPQGFLQDPGQALWVLVLLGLWSGVGFCAIIYLAALQDIPRELVEAASIDGARRRGVFLHVVLPALRPVTIFLLVWQTFESLQLFDLVFVTTRGGPLQSTTVVVLYVWQQAFEFFNAGYGAAAAYVLAFGLFVVALAWGAYQRRREARLA